MSGHDRNRTSQHGGYRSHEMGTIGRQVGAGLRNWGRSEVKYEEYRTMDGCALAKAIERGELDGRDVVEAAIRRTQEVNGSINAVTATSYEFGRHRAPPKRDGPLQGVPFLLKGLHQEWRECPPDNGSRAYRSATCEEDASVVRNWIGAGLVPLGRTNVPEFGIKAVTEPMLHGPCRNPWALVSSPGGSSGGSAAAVAAGIVPIAGASDGGGSIRIPAAWCGLIGLKVSRGLIPSGPARGEVFHGAGTEGVISRTVRDTAAALDAVSGRGEGNSVPYLSYVPQVSFTRAITERLPRLRIAVAADTSLGAACPEATEGLNATATLLENLGHYCATVRMPVDLAHVCDDYLRSLGAVIGYWVDEAKSRFNAKDSEFETETRILSTLGRSLSSVSYERVLQRRHEYIRQLETFSSNYDVLLTPTTASGPPRIGEDWVGAGVDGLCRGLLSLGGGRLLDLTGLAKRMGMEAMSRVPYTQLANVTGRPAISVPTYWGKAGQTPFGTQMMGRLGEDHILLQLAAELERASPWFQKAPQFKPEAR